MIFGLSIGFGPWAKAAFPVGSCEADLIAWMDRVGFRLPEFGTWDPHVIDTDEKHKRAMNREASGNLIFSRTLGQKAPIGRSYFTLAWNSNGQGQITEFYADPELMHFYLP